MIEYFVEVPTQNQGVSRQEAISSVMNLHRKRIRKVAAPTVSGSRRWYTDN